MKPVTPYNPALAFALAVFIATIISIPVLARLDRFGAHNVAWNFVFGMAVSLACWFFDQWLLRQPFSSGVLRHRWSRGILAIAVGALFAVALYPNIPWSNQYSPLLRILSEWKWFIIWFRGFVLSSFIFFVVNSLDVHFQAQQTRVENERLKRENLQAQLHSLQQQIGPHFLFNSLNTLHSMIQNESARQFVLQLSLVYRHLLRKNESDLSSLREELEFLRSYLFIQESRLGESLQVHMKVQDSDLDKRLPPLTLQMLVENAIKHNVASRQRPLLIRIESEQSAALRVSNGIQPRLSVEASAGTGLRNIADRYQILSGKTIGIDKDSQTFSVTLPLLP